MSAYGIFDLISLIEAEIFDGDSFHAEYISCIQKTAIDILAYMDFKSPIIESVIPSKLLFCINFEKLELQKCLIEACISMRLEVQCPVFELLEQAIRIETNSAVLPFWVPYLSYGLEAIKPKYEQIANLFNIILSHSNKNLQIGHIKSLLLMLKCLCRYTCSINDTKETARSWLYLESHPKLAISGFTALFPQIIEFLNYAIPNPRKSDILQLCFTSFPTETLNSILSVCPLDKARSLALAGLALDEKTLVLHLIEAGKQKCPVSSANVLNLVLDLLPDAFATDLWSKMRILVSMKLSSPASSKSLFPCLTVVLGEFMSLLEVGSLEWIEAKEDWCKSIENTILLLGRAFDTGPWKKMGATGSTFDDPKAEVLEKCHFLDSFHVIITKLKMIESERIIGIFNNFSSYVLSPCLKTAIEQKIDLELAIRDFLIALAVYPDTIKLWKKEVWDMVLGTNSFQLHAQDWIPVIQIVADSDMDKLKDMITNLSSSGSIFGSIDTINQSKAIHRISFIMLISRSGQYQKYLPLIQEKMTLFVKSKDKTIITEVLRIYCCIMLKVEVTYLSSSWPTLMHMMVFDL
jgi:hypothetical protein